MVGLGAWSAGMTLAAGETRPRVGASALGPSASNAQPSAPLFHSPIALGPWHWGLSPKHFIGSLSPEAMGH